MNNPTVVKCPTCGKSVPWTAEEHWRPFCSERCRLIDLGAWADGSNAIPGPPAETPPDSEHDGNSPAH
ncbi:MAG: DNA gyrase inhibitor YacG [Gammaproteobacteria bacterium HGW-Gammaproteobacteria-1]|nr:MAG: DNA gyrase inhibitor YacG [Gammaproteobacteria bacterium HGW-Gammaproteobacteria-1]